MSLIYTFTHVLLRSMLLWLGVLFLFLLQGCAGGWAESAVAGGSVHSHTHLQQVNHQRWLQDLDPHAACCQLITWSPRGTWLCRLSTLRDLLCFIFLSPVLLIICRLLFPATSCDFTNHAPAPRSPTPLLLLASPAPAEGPQPMQHLRLIY